MTMAGSDDESDGTEELMAPDEGATDEGPNLKPVRGATAEADSDGDEDMNETEDKRKRTPPSRKKAPPKHNRKAGKGRAPAVKGLTIPFRSTKRIMKLDGDVATIQNEAAIVATYAAELFVQKLAKETHRNAKNRGRNTIRYEDVAEVRSKSTELSFLDLLLP